MKTCALCDRPIHHTNKSGLCRHCWSIRRKAKDALAASLKPDADYRRRRLAHLSSERVQRYWENVEGLRG